MALILKAIEQVLHRVVHTQWKLEDTAKRVGVWGRLQQFNEMLLSPSMVKKCEIFVIGDESLDMPWHELELKG